MFVATLAAVYVIICAVLVTLRHDIETYTSKVVGGSQNALHAARCFVCRREHVISMVSTEPARHPGASSQKQRLSMLVVLLLLFWGPCHASPTDTTAGRSSATTAPPVGNGTGSPAAAVPTTRSPLPTPKWTIMIYMAADNDLECFGLDDMEEMMQGMAREPDGCFLTTCGSPCPADSTSLWSTPCSDGSSATGLQQFRCCPGSFPDVLVLVDRGASTCNPARLMGMDTELITGPSWQSTKELILLPGGVWQQQRDYGEMDMSQAGTLSSFLQRGIARFPPSANRKYMLILWDHGSGWQGYGVDQTCDAASAYNPNAICGMLSMQSITNGIAAGLVNPVDNTPVKFDIIGFDACLMAMYEVAAALHPYARYLLASQLLEPGHGWDYKSLGDITIASTVSPGSGAPTAIDVGTVFINGYMNEGREEASSGLTLALVDLTTYPQFISAVTNAANQLTTLLRNNASQAIRILQQRALLDQIAGADDNCDLGSALNRLRSIMSAGSSRNLLSSAFTNYTSLIKAFRRDGELSDGTGMAIYFPITLGDFSPQYTLLSRSVSAMGPWVTFLRQLYNSTSVATADKGTFAFIETYAVPFYAVSTKSWITYGTLTSDAGLSATLMYGFAAPDGQNLMMAGSLQGAVRDRQALGAWSGYLYVLVQRLDQQQRIALVNADESRTYNSSGLTEQLMLQIKVYYASSCTAPVQELRSAMYKYTYNSTSKTYRQQLFVSSTAAGSSTSSWGEVPPQQGGVIIPYLVSVAVRGGSGGVGANAANAASTSASSLTSASFGYADCLKWGYNSTIDIAGIKVSEAADILGLDLTQDVVTQLLVQAVDGSSAGLTGLFTPTQRTRAGCQCKQRWQYQASPTDELMTVYGTCINPKGAASAAFCAYEPDSCAEGARPALPDRGVDFCDPIQTLSDCKCHPFYTVDGETHYGTCHTDNPADPLGSWCIVANATQCRSRYRAHGFDQTDQFNSSVGIITGLDWDYCQTRTQRGCFCSTSWTYGGGSYNGRCVTGLPQGRETPLISNTTSWCMVDPRTCPWPHHLDGYPVDACTPRLGRVTEEGASCVLPVRYQNVTLYDCVGYNHSLPGPNRTVTPWCFTSTEGAAGNCKPVTCSQAIKQYCPATPPMGPEVATAADLTGWTSRDCLWALCYSRADQVNLTRCVFDETNDLTYLSYSYGALNDSSVFTTMLASMNTTVQPLPVDGPGGLDAYCSAMYGDLCVDTIMDPACPALSRFNNTWLISTTKASLCNLGCLKALCQLTARSTLGSNGGPACVDAELELYLRWDLMELMGRACSWASPPRLMCSKLLAPAPTCAGDMPVTSESTGNLTDGAQPGANYSPGSNCSWTINSPDAPYVALNFARFDTEPLYDTVTVQDFDGIVGIFSGNTTPGQLTTDTGLLQVTFTADDSIQASGFSAVFSTSSSPLVALPSCRDKEQLVQVSVRTRQFGSEISWVLTAAGSASVQQSEVLLSGGQLPSSLRVVLPEGSTSDPYKDYRSYPSYTCLAPGTYTLRLYDSYGDGWSGAVITVTQLVGGNAAMGCELVRETCTSNTRSVNVQITANAATDSKVCSNISLSNDAGFYIQAQLGIGGEDKASFNLAKQRKLRDALAALLDSDVSQIAIMNILDTNIVLPPLPSGNSSSSGGLAPSSSSSNTSTRSTGMSSNSSSARLAGSSNDSSSGNGTVQELVLAPPPPAVTPPEPAYIAAAAAPGTAGAPVTMQIHPRPSRRLTQADVWASSVDFDQTFGELGQVKAATPGDTRHQGTLAEILGGAEAAKERQGLLQKLLPLVTRVSDLVQGGGVDWQSTFDHADRLEQQQWQAFDDPQQTGQCSSSSSSGEGGSCSAAAGMPGSTGTPVAADPELTSTAKRRLTILELGSDGEFRKAGSLDGASPSPDPADTFTPTLDDVPVVIDPEAISSIKDVPAAAKAPVRTSPVLQQQVQAAEAALVPPPSPPHVNSSGLGEVAPSVLDSQLMGAAANSGGAGAPKVDSALVTLLAPAAAVGPLVPPAGGPGAPTIVAGKDKEGSRGPQWVKRRHVVIGSSADFKAAFYGTSAVMSAAEGVEEEDGGGTFVASSEGNTVLGQPQGLEGAVQSNQAKTPNMTSMVISGVPGGTTSKPGATRPVTVVSSSGAAGHQQDGSGEGQQVAKAEEVLQQRLGKAEVMEAPDGDDTVHVYTIPRILKQQTADGPSPRSTAGGSGGSYASGVPATFDQSTAGSGQRRRPRVPTVPVAALLELNQQRARPPVAGEQGLPPPDAAPAAATTSSTQRPSAAAPRPRPKPLAAHTRNRGMHSYEQPPPPAGEEQGTTVNVVNITVGSTDGTVSAGRPMRVRTAKKVGGRRRDPNRPHPLQQVVGMNGTRQGVAGTHSSHHAHQQQGQGVRNATRSTAQQGGHSNARKGQRHEAARKKHQQQQQKAVGNATTQATTPQQQQQQGGAQEDAPGRALLQRATPSPTPAALNRSRSVVNVTVRVAGYADANAAAEAALLWTAIVNNGSLVALMAARGWPGVRIQLLSPVETGQMRPTSLLSQLVGLASSAMATVVGAVVGGLVVLGGLIGLGVWWWCRRRRQRAATQAVVATASNLLRPLALYRDRPGTSSSGGSSSAGNSAPGTPAAAAAGGSYTAPGFSRFKGGGQGYAQMSAANTPSAVQGNPYFGPGSTSSSASGAFGSTISVAGPSGTNPMPSAPPLPVSVTGGVVVGYPPQQGYPPLQPPPAQQQQYYEYQQQQQQQQQQYYEYPPQQQQQASPVKSPAFMPGPTTSPQQQQQLPGPALAGAGPSFDLLGSPVGSGNFSNYVTPPATAPGITGLAPGAPAAGGSSPPASNGGAGHGMRRTGSAHGLRPNSPLGREARAAAAAAAASDGVPSYTDGRVMGPPGTAGQSPRQPAQQPW